MMIGVNRMKNKKGFVFIETIVVIVVLLTSLLYLYSTFIALSQSEKRRLLYDDVSYLYRTYFVKKYLTSQRIDRIIGTLSDENSSDNANYLISFGCGSRDMFDHYEKEGSFCEINSQDLHVSSFYLTYFDLSVLQNCTNQNEGLCATYSRVSEELGAYLRTLGGSGEDGYRLIVEYQEDGKGNFCKMGKHCLHYFASIKVGEDL